MYSLFRQAESWAQAHVSITWEVGLFSRDP